MTEVRRYEVLSTYEHLTHLTDIFYYETVLIATVSNNSVTTPLLFVISNGRQEVHARALTSA